MVGGRWPGRCAAGADLAQPAGRGGSELAGRTRGSRRRVPRARYAGHVLEVRVLDIQLRADWGWNLQVPMLGTLPEDFPDFRRIHIALDRARNVAKLPWGQELPLSPFFGNFGVAPPPSWGRLSSKEP